VIDLKNLQKIDFVLFLKGHILIRVFFFVKQQFDAEDTLIRSLFSRLDCNKSLPPMYLSHNFFP